MFRPYLIGKKPYDPAFVTVWKTDNPGTSNDDQITIPPHSTDTYDCTVYWGDGTSTVWDDTGANIISAELNTHTYPAAGTYTVRIVGNFPQIYFDDGGDKLKILELRNWGDIGLISIDRAFLGCSNFVITAQDVPQPLDNQFEGVRQAFQEIKAVNHKIKLYLVPEIGSTNMSRILLGIEQGVNYNLNQWNTSGIENMFRSLYGLGDCPNLRCDGWDFESVTILDGFLQLTTLSTENYDKLLISMASQDVNPDLDFHGGDSQYSGDPAGDPGNLRSGGTGKAPCGCGRWRQGLDGYN